METRVELEAAVIGTLFSEPQWFNDIYLSIHPKMFMDETFQKVMKFFQDNHKKGLGWTIELVADTYPDRADFIFELSFKTLMFSNFMQCVNRLIKHNLKAEMQELFEGTDDFNFDEINELTQKHQPISLERPEETTTEVIDGLIENMDIVGTVPSELPTSFELLNRKIYGFEREQITLVIAATSNSKTVFLWNMLLDIIKSEKKILAVDVEMPKGDLIIRLTAMIYKIPLDWIKSGVYLTGKKLDKHDREYCKKCLREIRDKYADKIILIRNIQIKDLRKMIYDTQPDVVIIDTIQSFTQRHRKPSGVNNADHITQICKELMDMTLETKVAMIQAVQVNRNTKGGVPGLGDIAESSGIANNAAYAIGVRDKYKMLEEVKDEEADRNESHRDVFDLNVCKVRHGETGRLYLTMNKEIALISEMGKLQNYEHEKYGGGDLPSLTEKGTK